MRTSNQEMAGSHVGEKNNKKTKAVKASSGKFPNRSVTHLVLTFLLKRMCWRDTIKSAFKILVSSTFTRKLQSKYWIGCFFNDR